MKSVKSWLVGTGVASVNLVTVINQVFHPARCTGNCGSCTYSCVPTVLGVVGMGLFVIVFRKIKYKFNSLKNRLHQFIAPGWRLEAHEPVMQSRNGGNQYLWVVPGTENSKRGKSDESSKD